MPLVLKTLKTFFLAKGMPCTQCACSANFCMSATLTLTLVLAFFH